MASDDTVRKWTGPETEFARIVAAAWHEFRYPRPALDEPTGAFERAVRAALDEAAATPSVRGPVEQPSREALARLMHLAEHRPHGCPWPDPNADHYAAADALLSRYDIRERGEQS